MAFSWSLVADGSSCSSIHRTRNSTQMHASIYCPLVIILRRNTLLGDVTHNRKVWIDRLQHVQLKIHIWKFQRYSLKTVSTASLTLLRAASRRSWAPEAMHPQFQHKQLSQITIKLQPKFGLELSIHIISATHVTFDESEVSKTNTRLRIKLLNAHLSVHYLDNAHFLNNAQQICGCLRSVRALNTLYTSLQ